MGVTNLSDEGIIEALPDLIEQGFALFSASKELRVSHLRVRNLATDDQIERLKENAEKNTKQGRPKKVAAAQQQVSAEEKARLLERFGDRIDQAIVNGLGIKSTIEMLETSHQTLMKVITPAQLQGLRDNGNAAWQAKANVVPDNRPRVGGAVIIKDPTVARAIMQDIIATHPALGRPHV